MSVGSKCRLQDSGGKMKRYAIVRVEKQCPFIYEKQDKRAFLNRCLKSNYQCKDCYGDTKEQMIRKVAQILFKNAPKETYQPRYIEQKRKILEIAKEIVEFLGVE